jgi:hypothetical protein
VCFWGEKLVRKWAPARGNLIFRALLLFLMTKTSFKVQTFFLEIPEISYVTLNFKPFESFNLIHWHNLNSLEGIYAKENGFLSLNLIILSFVS